MYVPTYPFWCRFADNVANTSTDFKEGGGGGTDFGLRTFYEMLRWWSICRCMEGKYSEIPIS